MSEGGCAVGVLVDLDGLNETLTCMNCVRDYIASVNSEMYNYPLVENSSPS